MVHKAFREALGETATQAGSENAPGRFRFDFSATGAVPDSVLQDVEARVNDLVLSDLSVEAELMTQQQAREIGAMALFGEKYGDQVRVISVGDWSRELCGGTHAGRSGQLGVIKLLGESSIGSGVRRVEALVGVDALPVPRARARPGRPAHRARSRCAPRSCPSGSTTSSSGCAPPRRRSTGSGSRRCCRSAGELAASARDVYGVRFVGSRRRGRRTAATYAGSRSTSVVGCPATCRPWSSIVGTGDGKPDRRRRAQRHRARAGVWQPATWSRSRRPTLGGGGGGKDDVAQGGGTDAAGCAAGARRTSSGRSPSA